MQRFFLPIMLVTGVAVLSACGQKGPLYLPNEPQAQPAAPAQKRSAEPQQEAGREDTQAEQDQ